MARQKINYEQLAAIDKKIALLKAQQDKEETLVDLKASLQQFDSEIAKINVDTLATKRIIAKLEKEKNS